MSKFDKYLLTDQMPHFTCPGCTHGIAWQAMIRAIDNLDLSQEETVMVCAIGCAGKMPVYLDFPTIRTPHGRALTFATGVKLANPDLNVIVFMGDGDATAIGGNHLVHASRRNIDLTAIVATNEIYGMTGGQYAPTTESGRFASTAPFGMTENQLDVCKLAEGAGATFIGRSDVYHVQELQGLIEAGIQHKGFSLLEIFTTCPTQFGRRNNMKRSSDLIKNLKDLTVTKKAAEKMSSEELEGKLIRGILLDEDKPEYVETYDRVTGFTKEGEKK